MRAWLFSTAVVASTIGPVVACAKESKIPLAQLPQGSLQAIKALFPAADIGGAAKETDEQKTVFEVTLKQNGRNIDVTVGTDGKVQLVEREILEKDLPQVVSQPLATKYPGATFKIVEAVERIKDGKPTLDYFETLLTTADKKTLEVQIAPDGKIMRVEAKSGDDE